MTTTTQIVASANAAAPGNVPGVQITKPFGAPRGDGVGCQGERGRWQVSAFGVPDDSGDGVRDSVGTSFARAAAQLGGWGEGPVFLLSRDTFVNSEDYHKYHAIRTVLISPPTRFSFSSTGRNGFRETERPPQKSDSPTAHTAFAIVAATELG